MTPGLDPRFDDTYDLTPPQSLFRSLPEGMVRAISKANSVDRPPHYTQGKVECIDALEAATAGLTGIEAVCTANAIKYLWRWKVKGGVEDLRKAQWYIKRLIDKETKK